MIRAKAMEYLTESVVVIASGGFLVWYLAVKLTMWPWGSFRQLPW
jgi:hypothetical protein